MDEAHGRMGRSESSDPEFSGEERRNKEEHRPFHGLLSQRCCACFLVLKESELARARPRWPTSKTCCLLTQAPFTHLLILLSLFFFSFLLSLSLSSLKLGQNSTTHTLRWAHVSFRHAGFHSFQQIPFRSDSQLRTRQDFSSSKKTRSPRCSTHKAQQSKPASNVNGLIPVMWVRTQFKQPKVTTLNTMRKNSAVPYHQGCEKDDLHRRFQTKVPSQQFACTGATRAIHERS